MGYYERHESKTGRKTVAVDWSSIPSGLPLSPEGIWPAPTNEKEAAPTRGRQDCMPPHLNPTPYYLRSLRKFNIGSQASPPGSSSTGAQGSASLTVGDWPVTTWQPSAVATPRALWLFSQRGYIRVICIIQCFEILRTVIAWQLRPANLHDPELPEEPEVVD